MAQSMMSQFFSAFDENRIVKHGLPSAAYTDNYFFEQEAKHLFANAWTFVGFAHDLAPDSYTHLTLPTIYSE